MEYYPGELVSHTWHDCTLVCKSISKALLKVEVLTPEIIRIRYATRGYFQNDFSYAIDENFETNTGEVRLDENDNCLTIITSAAKCRISKSDLKCMFLDLDDYVLNKEEKGFHWEYDDVSGNDIVQMTKHVYPSEVYYGLGDKPSDMNLRGRKFENWGSDCYGYEWAADPLYKNIPFYYGLHGGVGYGIFFDNSFRTYFDFASERDNAASYWAHGGEMNYYFIAGPELMEVNKRFARLTGTHDMPAMWSLGFQQCKWSYYPEEEVRSIAKSMRDYKIPCDAIYLDIDYMDGFRCFTWDNERFPDPKKLVKDLSDDGFKTVVIIDPGIKIDHAYSVFQEGLEKGYFLKRFDGTHAVGKVWPGECYFPDFTRPEVREWWADLYKGLIDEVGIAGVWNDMNEPALFEVESKTMPDDVLFDYDGNTCSHLKAHNIYGMQMARATYEGVKKHGNNKRGLIITRSGYAGLQRYSSIWTGDNISTWQHVSIANIQSQRMAISGVSFSGSDIGGFIGKPTPDMMVRWIQLAIFHPFCRVHSSQDDGDQEPWSFGEETRELFREAVEIRYRMLPYHYTAFYRHHRTGEPILRPLVFFDQHDPNVHNRNHEFLCGDHILTTSIHEENAKNANVYLPSGEWYDYWTNKVSNGSKEIEVALTPSTFPFFIKAGAIIPFYPLQQFVDEIEIEEVELKIYYTQGEETSYLYEDAHNGYEYEDGGIRYTTWHYKGTAEQLSIIQAVEGAFVPTYKRYKITIIGMPDTSKVVTVDGKNISSDQLVIPITFGELVIKW
ncbi:MAG: alpha-glucosidase [Saprospiraceae bacterium]|jgi:alpha-glucosidase